METNLDDNNNVCTRVSISENWINAFHHLGGFRHGSGNTFIVVAGVVMACVN